MLVLSRKLGERIVIGDGIVVSVLEMRGDRVRLGVSAPPATQVHREEVWNRIHPRPLDQDVEPEVEESDILMAT